MAAGSFISGTPQNKRYIATFQRPCRQDFPIRFLEHLVRRPHNHDNAG